MYEGIVKYLCYELEIYKGFDMSFYTIQFFPFYFLLNSCVTAILLYNRIKAVYCQMKSDRIGIVFRDMFLLHTESNILHFCQLTEYFSLVFRLVVYESLVIKY